MIRGTCRLSVLLYLLAAVRSVLGGEISFNRDIRPLLSDTCFRCHGPDSAQRQAGLRLDVRELALQPAESGETAIVPGKLNSSELVRRITTDDPELRMPPPDSGKTLSPQQIERLKQWIAAGAEYQGHWAFLPVQRPNVPQAPTELKPWPQNAIDQFVVARMSRDGLSPAGEVTNEALLRRVTLDLIGLPPSPAELDAFLADGSATAYEKVVDRLLQSPHYGERMALQWLDYARYADSNGFQVDSSRFQWPWRDWVIQAFNTNMPFDQFTIEQLAGDLLPNPSRSQLIATGFNRNHKLNGEGGIIAEEWRVETVIDRVETTGVTWLGLTFNCCRCHDHKYDPVLQREFYQLFAIFNNVPESGTLEGESKNTDPSIRVPTVEQEAELVRLAEAIRTAEANVTAAEKRLPELIAAWEPGFRKQLTENQEAWSTLDPREVKSLKGATLTKQPDGSYLASGKTPDHDTYEIIAPVKAGAFSGLLLECFIDPSLPEQSLGRYSNGNFVLTKVEAEITAPSLPEPLRAKIAKVEADYSQNGWEIQFVLQNDPSKGWAVDGPTKKENRRAMFLVESSLTVPADATITIRLYHTAISGHNIGRFRLSATSQPPGAITLKGARYSESLQGALAVEPDKRTAEQRSEIEKVFRTQVESPIKQAELALVDVKKKRTDYEAGIPTVMVMKELGKPRESFLLIRGQYDKRGEPVQAGLPNVFPPLPAGEPMNRLGFAKWLVDPSHPLTARVWVNRIWEKLFGTGLVKTTENLGSQADYPSHPELLDWLASEFMEPRSLPKVAGESAKRWDMKALQKLIVMSAAYRQSATNPESMAKDPENRLLARGLRFRLPAELVRDQALAVSGLLVPKIGGPSVRPYMPDGVWDETSRYGDLRNYKHDPGAGLYRRTLYTIWKRTAAPPTMLLFDAPNREICTVKRSRTNTPLQALSLLNEITFVESARKLGERMLIEGGATVDERLAFGFRLVTSRRPTAEELRILSEGWQADYARFQQQRDAATKLLAFGDSPIHDKLDVAELAAYTLAANVLLNLDEVVTRE